MPPQPTRPGVIRAPHADPFGQFRGAPLSMRRRVSYSALLFGVLLVVGVLPFILDATLPAQSEDNNSTSAVLEEYIITDGEWPLTLDLLEECTAVPKPEVFYSVGFECKDKDVRVIGMDDVVNAPLAVDRSVRAMAYAPAESMGAKDATDHAKRVNPQVLERAGANKVFMTDPYAAKGRGGADSEISYAVAFLRQTEGPEAGGQLVTFEVTSDNMDAAFAAAEEVMKTAGQHE